MEFTRNDFDFIFEDGCYSGFILSYFILERYNYYSFNSTGISCGSDKTYKIRTFWRFTMGMKSGMNK